MASEGYEIVIPKVLVIPTKPITGGSTNGELFISGGALCFMSGAGIFKVGLS